MQPHPECGVLDQRTVVTKTGESHSGAESVVNCPWTELCTKCKKGRGRIPHNYLPKILIREFLTYHFGNCDKAQVLYMLSLGPACRCQGTSVMLRASSYQTTLRNSLCFLPRPSQWSGFAKNKKRNLKLQSPGRGNFRHWWEAENRATQLSKTCRPGDQ